MRSFPRASTSGPDVDEDETGHALRVPAGEKGGDAAAERVADDDESLDAELRRGLFYVLDHRVVLVTPLGIPGGIAVAAVVERHDAVVRRDDRREVVPDVRVVAEAVEQEERYAFVAPGEQVQREIVRTAHASGRGLHGRPS